MKKAVFITHPDLKPVVYEHPWHKQGRVFNSKSLDLPPENGLLTLLTFFDCKKPVKCATVRATALGMFDLRLNNQRIGINTPDGKVYDELKPGWTDYRCRVFQFTYDITDMLREENCFTAQVSNGWWSGRISFGFYGFKVPAFCGEIEVEYEDGTTDLIASDESWDAAVCGPVMTADIWDGEYYDARMPHPCDFPGAYKWAKAVIDNDFEGVIQDPVGPPIRVRQDLTRYPLSATLHCGVDEDGSDFGKIHVLSKRVGRGGEATQLKAGESILLDMGQDMVGRPAIVIRAERGTIIRGYVAEMLNDSGDRSRGNDGPKNGIYIENYRSALARIYYVAAGTGEEAYKPTFAFYGFRYLELTADSDWELISACGEVITSVPKEIGEITTSNPEVNKLISNVLW
ncbi:MAG: family 78 glycoside hydrolase catalytic domain, partial [Clostridia bacterium]|nr:family 78 glycoside hydrolase catalytic domain [Clostridia bacterium]